MKDGKDLHKSNHMIFCINDRSESENKCLIVWKDEIYMEILTIANQIVREKYDTYEQLNNSTEERSICQINFIDLSMKKGQEQDI